MNTPNNKRLPDRIYVRRRIAALVILVVVACLIVWLLSALGGSRNKADGGDPSAVATTASPTSTSAAEESEATSASGSGSSDAEGSSSGADEESGAGSSLAAPSDAQSTEPSARQAERGSKNSCELKDLIISARSDRNSFAAGEQPKFYMTVDNPTNADCEIDLAENTLRFEVYDLATNKRIWSDMDCSPSDNQDLQVFPAGEQRYYEVIWSRTGSAPNACSNRENVPDGGYYLYTLVGDNHSEPITFNLHGA